MADTFTNAVARPDGIQRMVAQVLSDPEDHAAMLHVFRHGYHAMDGAITEHGMDGLLSLVWAHQRALSENSALYAEEAKHEMHRTVGCTDRCAHCCHQIVAITSSEAFLIAAYVTKEGIDVAHLPAYVERVSGMTHDQRDIRSPCVFLKERRCTIYEVRPEQCRSHMSFSRTACQNGFKRIPFLGKPKLVNSITNMGADYALMIRGLQICSMEIGRHVMQAMQPGAYEAWLRGERVLRPATNDHHEDSLREVARRALS